MEYADQIIAEREARLEREGKHIPREYHRSEFLFDAKQGKYWNTITKHALSAESVDSYFPPETWRQIEHEGAGRPARLRPSKEIRENRETQVDDSTWAPGYPTLIKNYLGTLGGLQVEKGAQLYNQYLAPAWPHPQVCNAEMWVELVRYLFKEEAEYFLDICAHMIQKPQEKFGGGVIMSSPQGAGKDSILNVLKRCVGLANAQNIDPDKIFDSFTPHYKSVLLVIDESRCAEKQHMATLFYDKMKTLTAELPAMLLVNEKGDKPYYVTNVCRVVVTTNDPHGFFIPQGDRRWYVMRSEYTQTETDCVTIPFWEAFNANKDDMTAAVYHYLKTRDLAEFSPNGNQPMTIGKQAMIEGFGIHDDSFEGHVFNQLKTADGELPKVLFPVQILDTAKAVMEGGGHDRNIIGKRNVGLYLQKAGYIPVKNPDSDKWRVGA